MQADKETQTEMLAGMTSLRQEMTYLNTVMLISMMSFRTDMETMMTSLSNTMASLRDDITSQLTTIKKLNTLLSQENQNLRSDLNNLRAENNKLQGDMDQLQEFQSKIRSDEDTMSDVMKMKKTVKQLEDLWKKEKSAIDALETRLKKLGDQVAFHAVLTRCLTVTRPQTIVCDRVDINVGRSYDSHTGVFTAPMSGLYCFMVSSGPVSNVGHNESDLRILMENEVIGGLFALDTGRDTGHCVVHVLTGQKVWLMSHHAGTVLEVTFAAVHLTGVLLHRDL